MHACVHVCKLSNDLFIRFIYTRLGFFREEATEREKKIAGMYTTSSGDE